MYHLYTIFFFEQIFFEKKTVIETANKILKKKSKIENRDFYIPFSGFLKNAIQKKSENFLIFFYLEKLPT